MDRCENPNLSPTGKKIKKLSKTFFRTPKKKKPGIVIYGLFFMIWIWMNKSRLSRRDWGNKKKSFFLGRGA